jgi:hypothetical protein
VAALAKTRFVVQEYQPNSKRLAASNAARFRAEVSATDVTEQQSGALRSRHRSPEVGLMVVVLR